MTENNNKWKTLDEKEISIDFNYPMFSLLHLDSLIVALNDDELENIHILISIISKSKVVYPAGYTLDFGSIIMTFYKYKKGYMRIQTIHIKNGESGIKVSHKDDVNISFDVLVSLDSTIEKYLKEKNNEI